MPCRISQNEEDYMELEERDIDETCADCIHYSDHMCKQHSVVVYDVENREYVMAETYVNRNWTCLNYRSVLDDNYDFGTQAIGEDDLGKYFPGD